MDYYCFGRYSTVVSGYSDSITATTSITALVMNGYESYSFDSATGYYTISGDLLTVDKGTTQIVYLINGGGSTGLSLYECSFNGSTTAFQQKTHSGTIIYGKGTFLDYVYSTYDDLPHGGVYGGNWYDYIGVVPVPYNYKFDTPTSGETVSGTYSISWSKATYNVGLSLTYYIELSLDNGSTYHSIGSVSNGSTTTLSYNFSTENSTTSAVLRMRAYDTLNYGDYVTSSVFTIVGITTDSGYQMMI